MNYKIKIYGNTKSLDFKIDIGRLPRKAAQMVLLAATDALEDQLKKERQNSNGVS